MITWFQTFFLKHNKWLFGALIIVITVTFVLTVGPQGIFDGRGSFQTEKRDFFGYNLNSEIDQSRMFRNAELSAQLNPQIPFRGEALTQYAFMRVRGLALAEDLGIPQPDRAGLEAYVQSLPVFQNQETGAFDPELYTQATDFLRDRLQISNAQLAQVLREDYRIQKVVNALAGPGFLVAYEGQQNLLDERSGYTVQIARYNFEDFEPEQETSEEDLRSFYEENPARYAIPERIQVRAVQFYADNFIADVTDAPAEADLNRIFQRNRFRYQAEMPGSEDGEDAEPPQVTLEDVREQVEQDWLLERARRIAEERSEVLIDTLHREGISRDSGRVDTLIEELGGVTTPVSPYSRDQPPTAQSLPRPLFNSMWLYQDGGRFFSDPAQTRSGAAVLLFEEVIPERQPSFDEVADKVEQDYLNRERRRLFSEHLTELREQLVAASESDSSDFAQAAEALGFKVEEPQAFEGHAVPPTLRQNRLWDDARFLETGEFSEPVLQANAGYIVRMVERNVPEIEWDSEEVVSRLQEQREETKLFAGWILLNQLMEQSLQAITPPSAPLES